MKYWLLLPILCLAYFISNNSALSSPIQRILIIESYHASAPWDNDYVRGIKATLGPKHIYKRFQLDTKRLPKSAFKARSELAWQIYESFKPDLVFLGDDNALSFLGPKLAQTSTPVVYLGINRNPRDAGFTNYPNITGVLERPILKRSIIEISKILQNKVDSILVLFDSSFSSHAVSARSVAFGDKSEISLPNTKVTKVFIKSFDEWKHSLSSAKELGYDAIILGTYHTILDNEGAHVNADQVILWSSENSPLPLFCFWETAVGPDKAIGGYVISGEEQGIEAAKIALKIFEGQSPQSINPKMAEQGKYLFSNNQLVKWQITLPPHITKRASFTD